MEDTIDTSSPTHSMLVHLRQEVMMTVDPQITRDVINQTYMNVKNGLTDDNSLLQSSKTATPTPEPKKTPRKFKAKRDNVEHVNEIQEDFDTPGVNAKINGDVEMKDQPTGDSDIEAKIDEMLPKGGSFLKEEEKEVFTINDEEDDSEDEGEGSEHEADSDTDDDERAELARYDEDDMGDFIVEDGPIIEEDETSSTSEEEAEENGTSKKRNKHKKKRSNKRKERPDDEPRQRSEFINDWTEYSSKRVDNPLEMKALIKMNLPSPMKLAFIGFLSVTANTALEPRYKQNLTIKAGQDNKLGNVARDMIKGERGVLKTIDKLLNLVKRRIELIKKRNTAFECLYRLLLGVEEKGDEFSHITFDIKTGENAYCSLSNELIGKGKGWMVNIYRRKGQELDKREVIAGEFYAQFMCYWQILKKLKESVECMAKNKFKPYLDARDATDPEKRLSMPCDEISKWIVSIEETMLRNFMCSLAWFYKMLKGTPEGHELSASLDLRWFNVVVEH